MAHVVKSNQRVQLKDMKDGQVASIIKWSTRASSYEGLVVQRYNDDLIVISGDGKRSWPGIFKQFASSDIGLLCEVEILQKGSLIQL